MFTYFWERERERERENEWKRSRARGRHRIQSRSRLWAVSTVPNVGLEPTNREIMTWAKVGHLTDWATQVPLSCSHLISFYLHIPLTGHTIHSLLQCSTILVTQHFASTAFSSCYQWKPPLYPCSHRLPFTALFLCPSGLLMFHQLCLSLS